MVWALWETLSLSTFCYENVSTIEVNEARLKMFLNEPVNEYWKKNEEVPEASKNVV